MPAIEAEDPHVKRYRPDTIGKMRLDLATAYRMAAKHKLNEGVCNHFTMAISNTYDEFLVIPHGVSWELVRPEQLLLVNAKGDVLEGDGEVERTALHIHAAIHEACGKAGVAVLHTHMPFATAMCAVRHDCGGKLLQIHQNSCRFFGAVKYDERYGGLADDAQEGCAIARAFREPDGELGHPTRVVFLANHGVVVIGRSVAEAWHDLYYLERACMFQVHALAAVGGDLSKVMYIDDATVLKVYKSEMGDLESYGKKHLAAGLSEIRNIEPTFGL